MININELLDEVTNDVVIEIMEENGSPLFKRSIDGSTHQECLWFKTICHGGDSHKLCYFTETKDFYCYTNCGRMPFFEFIKKVNGFGEKDFGKCLTYVAEKVGYKPRLKRNELGALKPSSLDKDVEQYQQEKIKYSSQYFEPTYNLKHYDPYILNYFDHNAFYEGWIKEGISTDTMTKYGICWYEFQKYIVIPHYDIDGNLIGIRRRSLKPEDVDNKYMPLFVQDKSFEHQLGLNLYGLYQNKEIITKLKTAVIVEGEKSVLMGDTFYGKYNNLVATCGFNVSNYQIRLLQKLGVRVVYLGFDKDFDIRKEKEEEYKKDEVVFQNYLRYRKRIQNLALKLQKVGDFEVFIIEDKIGILSLKDSPTDKGKENFEKLKKTASLQRIDSYAKSN